jgi:NTE family protein
LIAGAGVSETILTALQPHEVQVVADPTRLVPALEATALGAYIGAMYTPGMSAEEMDARAFKEWVRRRPFGDYTFPRHALVRGQRAKTMLARTFGDAAIEELPRAFFCASADLRTAGLVLSRWAPVADAVGVSMCLPVIAPPQVRGKQMLVDGSLVDNLPVLAMAELAEGPIIAVDVKASLKPPSHDDAPSEPNGHLSTIGETLVRVLVLGSSIFRSRRAATPTSRSARITTAVASWSSTSSTAPARPVAPPPARR